MLRNVDLPGYLPPYLQEYRELMQALNAENPEFKAVWKETQWILDNNFVVSADGYGLLRFEKILGIHPGKSETLEERRLHILARLNERRPYTLRALRELLGNICGDRFRSASVDTDRYTLEVNVLDGKPDLFPIVRELLDHIVPANIIWGAVFEQTTPLPAAQMRIGGAVIPVISSSKLSEFAWVRAFRTPVRAGTMTAGSLSSSKMLVFPRHYTLQTSVQAAVGRWKYTVTRLPPISERDD